MSIANRVQIVFCLTLAVTCLSSKAFAGEVRVAVASNFISTMKEIARTFESKTGDKIVLASGSTGKHFAQITNGAPFDIFFAADVERPKRLEEQGVAVAGSRFTYAIGKLVLWSPLANLVDEQGKVLQTNSFVHLAIANPKLAPYGRAAQQIMLALGVWDTLQKKTVRGENISQAFQFIKSGNAELGFVSYSQVKSEAQNISGSFWMPAQSLYDPVEQQAVLLKDNAIARKFIDFIKGEEARTIIRNSGYDTP